MFGEQCFLQTNFSCLTNNLWSFGLGQERRLLSIPTYGSIERLILLKKACYPNHFISDVLNFAKYKTRTLFLISLVFIEFKVCILDSRFSKWIFLKRTCSLFLNHSYFLFVNSGTFSWRRRRPWTAERKNKEKATIRWRACPWTQKGKLIYSGL